MQLERRSLKKSGLHLQPQFEYELFHYRLTHSASELSGFTCTSSLTEFTPRLLHYDNDVKEVVSSRPSVTLYKSTNKKIGIRTVYESWIIIHLISLLTGKYEPNKLTLLPITAQLVEHRTGISRGSRVRIPLKPWYFFTLLLSSCLNWKILITAMIILNFHHS